MQKLKTGRDIPVKFRPIAEGEDVPKNIKEIIKIKSSLSMFLHHRAS